MFKYCVSAFLRFLNCYTVQYIIIRDHLMKSKKSEPHKKNLKNIEKYKKM
jgi:hypothetical protein